LKTPELPEQYVINHSVEGLSIDGYIVSVFEKLHSTPILSHPASRLELLEQLDTKLPKKGVPVESILKELDASIIKYCRRNAHPGCWAYITSPGLPIDSLSYAIIAALNQNVTGFHSAPGASIIENIVIDWIVQLTGMPKNTTGLLQGGGSLANLSALTVARNQALGNRLGKHGLNSGPRLLLLIADTVHFSVLRAAKILGLGTDDVINIKTNKHNQMCVSALEKELESLSERGDTCIVGVVASAGTTTTGSIDPLYDIAQICNRYGIWLHVDAAYGGGALLAPDLRCRLKGIELANSVTIDLHKWFYMSVDCSVLLYRDPGPAYETFSIKADYVRENSEYEANYFEMSPEVSRRFRALAVWFAFRYYGTEKLGQNVLYNTMCAEYLADRVESIPVLELMGRPQLSICCFRYVPLNTGLTGEEINMLNDRIVRKLAENSNFLISPTYLNGLSVLRVCIRSYTTRAKDIDNLIDEVCKIGAIQEQNL
jgi:aromatic-L-amino-acid decarboxylase